MSKREVEDIISTEKTGSKGTVTTLLDKINLQLIENIDIENSKMSHQELEASYAVDSGINKERIKEIAMSHAKSTRVGSIDSVSHNDSSTEAHNNMMNDYIAMTSKVDTPACNIQEISKRRKQRYLRRSILIPLVAIISLIGVTFAALQSNSTLGNLFGELFPYEDQVQVVGSHQTKAGIIYTVEGAFIDYKSGLFIVSMRKEDGTAFEEGTAIGRMQLHMNGPNSMGWHISSYLEDNNKRLVGVMNLSCEKALYRKQLALRTEDIIKTVNKVESMEIDLDKLYKEDKFSTLKGNEENWYNYKQEEGLRISPIQDFSLFSIDDVRISERGLSVLTSYPDVEDIENRSIELKLIDTRTGKEYIPNTYSKWDQEQELNKDDFVFENLKAADLPYLKAQLINNYDEKVIKECWEVDFKLSKNSQVISKRMLQSVKIKDERWIFTKIEVSPLGVTLRGYGNTGNINELPVNLVMKDGEEVSLTSSGSSNGSGGMTCYYDLGTVEGSYIPSLIVLEDVRSIKVGEKTIRISY